jgi:hypothetical protein
MHELRHQRDFERIAQADAEHALGLGGVERRLRMQRLLQREQQRLDDARELERAGRRRHAVRGAHEQFVAQRHAQALERAAQRRLADEQALGRARDAAFVQQRVEHQQQVQVEPPEITFVDVVMISNDLNDRPAVPNLKAPQAIKGVDMASEQRNNRQWW